MPISLSRVPIPASPSLRVERNAIDLAFEEVESNLQSLDGQIVAAKARIDTLESPPLVQVSANTTLVLADVRSETVFANISLASKDITVPTPAAADIGKRFHLTASGTYALPLVIKHATLNGLLRNSSNSAGPFTVNNGTLTVTVVPGLVGSIYYSISGDFS